MAETNVEKLARERREAEAITLKENREMAELFNYDKLSNMNDMKKEVIQVIHRTVAKKTNLSEFAYFLQYCRAVGLDPILKEVWCYKDKLDNVIVFTGKDGFLKLAKKDQHYLGFSSAYVCENDDFEIDIPNADVYHKFKNADRGKTIGAWSRVKSKSREEKDWVLVWVPFEEFNKGQSTWANNPTEMIKKVADSHALKQFAGIPGLQNEYEWKANDNGIVTHVTELKTEEKKAADVKVEQRIEKMIESAKTLDDLRKLMPHTQTSELVELYEAKKKDLSNGRTQGNGVDAKDDSN